MKKPPSALDPDRTTLLMGDGQKKNLFLDISME
jgi:hypothetical protein